MNQATRSLLFGIVLLLPAAARAQASYTNVIATNRLSFSARMGFNISATFKGVAPAPRVAPDGSPYNYDDGYVHTDVSGNFGGQTWNWGYDNSASQISVNNTILLSRTTPDGGGAPQALEENPSLGGEITYNRLLGAKDKWHYGFEAAANYLNISLHGSQTFSGNMSRVTDAYPFTSGTTPPTATPGNPYQGSFNGPGFVIGDTPTNSVTVLVPGIPIVDNQRYDGDLWGFRLGPYVEVPLGERWNLAFSGGLALGLLNSSASWSQTAGGTSISGSGSDFALLWGYYVGANVSYQFSEHWSAVGGAQFQSLGTYTHTYGGRDVEVDLSHALFVTLGVSYTF